MCGITGFNWEDKELIRAMAGSISYRGPDQEGYFTDAGISLGFRRLAIIDLSKQGSQPMFNEEGTLCVVFNGEIYNFQELRTTLEKKGHKFKSHTDTEVILHAYEEYGVDCLKQFNGMFAFALWDLKKKELFIARDRIGIKPLYYYFKKSTFLFASEIKALLQWSELPRILNKHCLQQAIAYEFPIKGETLLTDVQQLEPAHYLLLKNNTLTIKRYWDITLQESNESPDVQAQKLRELLAQSVQRMLVSDVPLGVALSGGLDSSVVAALASKSQENSIKTFTAGFDVPEDEYGAARKVAEHCRTDHTEIHLSAQDYVKGLIPTLWHMEFPFSRPAMVPVYHLYKNARKYLTVSLSGEGADELFAGYNRYVVYSELSPESEVSDSEAYVELKKKTTLPFKEKVNYIASSAFMDDKNQFFSEDLLTLPQDIDAQYTFGKELKKTTPPCYLNEALRYELKTEIPYFHCNKLDKLSMASSHEVRVPYLDHTVVEYAMTIPGKQKYYGSEKKIILQKLAAQLLPPEIVKRKKLPMVTPISDYFKKELATISQQVLDEQTLKKRGYYNVSGVQKLLRDVREQKIAPGSYKRTREDPHRKLLFLTNLELWYRLFIEGDVKKKVSFDIGKYT